MRITIDDYLPGERDSLPFPSRLETVDSALIAGEISKAIKLLEPFLADSSLSPADQAWLSEVRARTLSGAEAIAAWSAAQKRWEALDHPPGVIRTRMIRGGMLYKAGETAAGLALLEETLKIIEMDTRGIATSLRVSINGLAFLPDLVAAPYYRRLIAIGEKQVPQTISVCLLLNQLGFIALKNQATLRDEAVRCYREITQITEAKHLTDGLCGLAYLSLGGLYEDDDKKAAASCYLKASAFFSGKDAVNEAMSLGRLASVYMTLDLSRSRDAFEQALLAWDKVATHPANTQDALQEKALCCLNYSSVLAQLGEYLRGREVLWQGYTIAHSSFANSELEGDISNNSAVILGYLGDLSAAELFYRRALEIYEKVKSAPEKRNIALVGLTSIAIEQQDSDKAQEHLEQARKAHTDSSNTSAVESYLAGRIEVLRGKLPLARDHFQQSLNLFEKTWALDIDSFAAAGDALARMHLMLGELKPASTVATTVLDRIQKQAIGTLNEALLRTTLGRVALKNNKPDEAQRQLNRAWKIHQQWREVLPSQDSRVALGTLAADTVGALVESFVEQKNVLAAFQIIEQGRARALAEQLAGPHTAFEQKALYPKSLQPRLEKLVSERGAILAAMTALPDTQRDAKQSAYQARLIELGRESESLAEEAKRESPKLWQTLSPPSLSWAQARALLPDKSLLLMFQTGEEATMVLALASSGMTSAKSLPLPMRVLSEKVQAFREAIQTDQKESVLALGKALFVSLLGPLWPQIQAAERLVVCLDGPLHHLPFAALVTPSGRVMGELKPLSHVVSLSTEALSRRAKRASGSPLSTLALGDPAYPSTVAQASGESALPTKRDLPNRRLPQSRGEVQAICKLFGGVALLDRNATRRRFLQSASGCGIIHLACHGFADTQEPLASGLRFAPEGKDSGVLQAWELYVRHVPLRAELVTLSACQTGTGRTLVGEGTQSLARAFQFAGSRSVVSTLWSVDDASTAYFMGIFYKHLKQGLAKDVSLQLALRATRQRFPDARSWAAFVLTGDPSPLERK